MPDEETVEITEPVETPKEKPATQPVIDSGAEELKAELEKVRKALKDANKEAAERRKRNEELEAAEAKRKEAEMTESEKAAARVKELESKLAEQARLLSESNRRELQRKVAKAVGLPDGFAERLRGDTEEDLTADANAVLELLPKQDTTEQPKKPNAPKLIVNNPGDGKKGETRAEMKARLQGATPGNVWDADWHKSHGGGAVFVDKD